MPVVYHCGKVSVSPLGSFLSVGYSSKPFNHALPVSIIEIHIQEYFNNNRGRKRKLIKPHQEEANHEDWINQSKVISQAELVVGYWDLIPIESGTELLTP